MRKLIIAALGWCALGAQAQTETHPPSTAQSLSCLVKPGDPPRYPTQNKADKGFGAMRVLLKFTTADAAPTVEVTFNSAREDMQDAVYRYLRGYRLPCLTPKDGVVTAVQEFSFANTDADATPLPAAPKDGALPFCLVMPRTDMQAPPPKPTGRTSVERIDLSGTFASRSVYVGRPILNDSDKVEHVVVAATFAGDGTQPPDVKLIYSSSQGPFEQAVRDRVALYRMPCRTANQEPQSFQQTFSMIPGGRARFAFTSEKFTLREFLGMTKEPGKLRARYDFNTMGCPFKVSYTLYGGSMPNTAEVIGPQDPNKLPFLSWLAGLKLALDDDQANGLFGSTLQINIGCGALKLGGEG